MKISLLDIIILKIIIFLKGPIIIIAGIIFLSSDELGLWYTFTSMSAIALLSEVGTSKLIAIYTSQIDGKHQKTQIHELTDLLSKILPLFKLIQIVTFIILLTWGLYILAEMPVTIKILWGCFCAIMIKIVEENVNSGILVGLNQVSTSARIRSISLTTSATFTLGFLFVGLGIGSLVVSAFLQLLIYKYLNHRELSKAGININKIVKKDFKNDVLSVQLKYIISWLSGFFVFNFLTPLIFKFQSAEIAGKIGVSFALFRMLSNVVSSYNEATLPAVSSLVGDKKLSEANKIYIQGSAFAVVFYITFSGLIILSVDFIDIVTVKIASRELLLLVAGINFINLIIGLFASYTRFFRDEPLYIVSVIHAFLFAVCCILYIDNNIEEILFVLILVSLFVLMITVAMTSLYVQKLRRR